MTARSETGPFSVPGAAEIIAHRGFSAEAPENTIVALQRALEAEADAVEFDLHTAGDGTPVLLHDETLRRTTDVRGRVTDYTVDELALLDAGSWFDAAFAGEPLPTLEAALAAMAGAPIRVYAEVKGVRRQDDLDRIVEVVEAAGRLDSTVFISMDWGALERIREVRAEALLGFIVEKPRRIDDGLARAAGDPRALLDFDARILLRDPSAAERAHAASIPLATWTVDSTDDAGALLQMGVPRITTNRVRDLVAWKSALEAS